ncbi:acyl carrier protein [Sciscionella sediminilitoris]|uniref:acyl carrier protein n=1 Tax=Sciscionella sediminilitoris TaxID=1445613 RepID=UPI0004DF15E3|nr:acyl carrier protein [Sciscionella sp. SE31]
MNETTETLRVLARHLAHALELAPEDIDPAQPLTELPNVDSLRLLDAVSATQDELGVQISEEALFTARTVADLAELCRPVGHEGKTA